MIGAGLVAAALMWQGVTSGENPEPTTPGTPTPVAILDRAVVVFCEGLEGVPVLAAITAGLMRSNQSYQRPIGAGVVASFIATLAT